MILLYNIVSFQVILSANTFPLTDNFSLQKVADRLKRSEPDVINQ